MDIKINVEHMAILCIMLLPIIVSIINFYSVHRIKNRYKIFKSDTSDKNMETLLENYIRLVDSIKNKNINMEDRISKIENSILNNIQKVGIVKYDAVEDMSSNLSFSLALLDGHNTGVIITELYLRNTSTIYIREIKNGSCNIDLSNEEQEAMLVAQEYTIKNEEM